jgi:hypothetical protein
MLSGKTIDEAIASIGHRRGTYGSELIRALGFKGRLRRVTLKNGLSDLCIMSIRYTGKRGGHWAIKEFDTVLDPAYPYRVDFDVWKKIADDAGVKVKSIFDLTPFYRIVD